jgi:hypothetical protein
MSSIDVLNSSEAEATLCTFVEASPAAFAAR